MHSTRPGSASFAMPPHTSLPGKCGQVPGTNPERCGAADEAGRFLFEAVDSTRVGCMRSPDPAPTALDRYFRRIFGDDEPTGLGPVGSVELLRCSVARWASLVCSACTFPSS